MPWVILYPVRPQKSGCGRLLLTSPHTYTRTPASCRSYEVFDLFDTYSKHPPDLWDCSFIFPRISDRQRICLFRCAMRDSIVSAKNIQLHPLTRVQTKITVGKKKEVKCTSGVEIPTTLLLCLWESTRRIRPKVSFWHTYVVIIRKISCNYSILLKIFFLSKSKPYFFRIIHILSSGLNIVLIYNEILIYFYSIYFNV